jgi:L-2-hydroxyglutarate oxidase LhgO
MLTCDFLVIGGGVIGIAVARELKHRHPSATIIVLEKEPRCGEHASGRNSGVLHAGFYYTPDSLKARLTRLGNERMTAYCLERNLPIRRCGKLVVARDDDELQRLDELHRRGVANGVSLQSVDAQQAHDIEPRARTHQRALWSPTTSSVDAAAVMAALVTDARSEGVDVRTAMPYRAFDGRLVRTGSGSIDAGFVVNSAGLQADLVARDFGFSRDHRVLPFKGLYLYSDEPPESFRTHIYPVPDPRFPFLGVHVTVSVDGRSKIGPTAIPAFWREQYGGFSGFRAKELLEVAWRGAGLLVRSGPFRRLAVEELRKYSPARMAKLASHLATGIDPEHYRRWGKPGIRAQLMNTRTRTLEMDFLLEGDAKSLHILNAVSPGFTCALPFAELIADRIDSAPSRTS